MAHMWPVGGDKPSRLVLNLRFITAFFHAVELDFYRNAYFMEPLTEPASRAISQILSILTIIYETEGLLSLSKNVWCLFVAGVETRDPVYQNWILGRMKDISIHGSNVVRATKVLEAVIQAQRIDPHTRVDYLDWIRQGAYEEFVI
jgi:hypothetical protein